LKTLRSGSECRRLSAREDFIIVEERSVSSIRRRAVIDMGWVMINWSFLDGMLSESEPMGTALGRQVEEEIS